MKFQADANISRSLVETLRSLGQECREGTTIPDATDDPTVLRDATDNGRLLFTEDKGFGELVFLRELPSLGILLIRLPGMDQVQMCERLVAAWPDIEGQLAGAVVTLTKDAVRSRRIER